MNTKLVQEELPFVTGVNAAFTHERLDWNEFHFKTISPISSKTRVNWDFGNGVTSQKDDVVQVFDTPGEYEVTLSLTAPDGTTSTKQTIIEIQFFHFKNIYVMGGIGLLGILLIVGFIMIARSSKRSKNA